MYRLLPAFLVFSLISVANATEESTEPALPDLKEIVLAGPYWLVFAVDCLRLACAFVGAEWYGYVFAVNGAG